MSNINIKTNTNDRSRATLFRRLANLPIENQLQIMKNTINFQFKFKHNLQEVSNSESLYIALINSIHSYTNKVSFNRYAIDDELKKLKKQEIIKVKRIKNKFRKHSVKKDKLLSKKYWLIVEKLKIVDKMSFREISNYLLTFHKFKVDYSYIAKTWKEEKNDQ